MPLIQSICNCLVGKTGVADVTNISTGDNALRCALVIDKALESYYGNRNIDYWNYPGQWPGLKLRADELQHRVLGRRGQFARRSS